MRGEARSQPPAEVGDDGPAGDFLERNPEEGKKRIADRVRERTTHPVVDHPSQRDPAGDAVGDDAAPEGHRPGAGHRPKRVNDQQAEDGQRRERQDQNSGVHAGLVKHERAHARPIDYGAEQTEANIWRVEAPEGVKK